MQEPLKGDIKADILIIGAGAAGLASALALMKRGLKVILLERNICGGSSTGKSAGFLTPASELDLSELMHRFGPQGAKDLWKAAMHGIQIMCDIVKTNDIRCDLIQEESLFVGNGPSGWKQVQAEAKARKTLGYPATTYDANQLTEILGSKKYSGGVLYPDTYGIDGLRYAQGVKRVLLDNEVAIHEASEVVSIKDHTAFTHLGSVTADKIIFCADKPKQSVTKYYWNVYHAQTFLAVSEPLNDKEIRGMFPKALYQCWDSDLIYTYWRLTGDNRLLVGGGSLLTTYTPNDIDSPHVIRRVIKNLKKKFPAIQKVQFIQYWPGRIDMTRDLLPTLIHDRQKPWLYFVLGCVGLPWATFCGHFASRHALNERVPDDEKYYRYFSVDRKFLIPLWLERVLGKQIVFSLSNAWAEYYQKG